MIENFNEDMLEWRDAALIGCDSQEVRNDVYRFEYPDLVINVYTVPANWIVRSFFPSEFFKTHSLAVGCVKTNILDNNLEIVPCIIFNMQKEPLVDTNDPVFFIMQSCILRMISNRVTIIRSADDPWLIGAVYSEAKPVRWMTEDLSRIQGIDFEKITGDNVSM